MPDADEIELAGGALAPVYRVGDTVRRHCGPWTPAVHAWLDRLATEGFAYSPRVYGIDAQGREVLDYIDGTCGESSEMWADDTLAEVAQIMRAYHDVPLGHAGPWRLLVHTPGPPEVICHTDFGPWNTVWRDGRIAGVIDWDWSAPAPRLWDVAHTVWRWVPWYAEADVDRAARTRLFCEAYGISTDGLADMIELRIRSEHDTIRDGAASGDPYMIRLWESDEVPALRANLDWFRDARTAL